MVICDVKGWWLCCIVWGCGAITSFGLRVSVLKLWWDLLDGVVCIRLY